MRGRARCGQCRHGSRRTTALEGANAGGDTAAGVPTGSTTGRRAPPVSDTDDSPARTGSAMPAIGRREPPVSNTGDRPARTLVSNASDGGDRAARTAGLQCRRQGATGRRALLVSNAGDRPARTAGQQRRQQASAHRRSAIPATDQRARWSANTRGKAACRSANLRALRPQIERLRAIAQMNTAPMNAVVPPARRRSGTDAARARLRRSAAPYLPWRNPPSPSS
jgi:hypothetical protein